MTRMWLVPTKILCKDHLLGEHKELHQEVGTLENHPHGLKVVQGHADKNQVDTSKIQERHDELVQEMKERGYNHESPLDYTDEHNLGTVDSTENLQDLLRRCEECRERTQKHLFKH